MRMIALFPAALLAACTQFPELDAVANPDVKKAPYPTLVPIETLLTGPEPRADANEAEGLLARASALEAEATRLQSRQPTPEETARIARLRQRAAALREAE